MALAPSIIGVGLASVLLGFGHLIFEIASQASVPRYSTDATLDKGFGWQTAGISAGQLLGPLLGGLILGNSSGDERMHLINISLWVGAAFALISIPLMLWPVRLQVMPTLTSEIPLAGSTVDEKTSPRVEIRDSPGQKKSHQRSDDERATTLKILRRPGVGVKYLCLVGDAVYFRYFDFLPASGGGIFRGVPCMGRCSFGNP